MCTKILHIGGEAVLQPEAVREKLIKSERNCLTVLILQDNPYFRRKLRQHLTAYTAGKG